MARTSRASNAPSCGKQATPTVAQSTRSIDSFGRVSKRLPLTPQKALTHAPTAKTISPSRKAAVERYLAQKETDKAPTITAKSVQPSIPTRTLKTAPLLAAAAYGSISQRKRRAAEALDADDSYSHTLSSLPQPTSAKRARRTVKAKTSVLELLNRAAQKNSTLLSPEAEDSDSDSTPVSSLINEKKKNFLAQLDYNFSNSFSSPASPPSSTSSSPRPISTAPTTPCESENECDEIKIDAPSANAALPLELLDLLSLQTALTKTLAVHHAHHGTHTPVDLRSFCPGVAQAWGRRRVTLEDVQRSLGVVSLSTDSSIANVLFLSDYSRGKICIEMQPASTGQTSTLADRLNTVFEASLRARWLEAKTTSKTDVKQFIAALPKAPVTKCASLLQSSALRTKGQRSLEELMNGIALQKQEKEAHEAMLKAPRAEAMQVDGVTAAAAATPSAPMNLLDRIRFRQMQRTQLLASGDLAKPPTPEELERRAALQRVGDIAEVLSMLCTAASMRQSNRLPFGMTAIVSKIKDSLRTPIAREEAAACVRLLSKEVAPQWLQLVSMGGREIVIMMADRAPGKTEIHDRVRNLMQ
ncbi:hypothetical protein SEPCBS57363_000218 [Sporothrix epigloea]|uniref:DNA replication factor Cdt1 C-terminal domain-containing protein n=1 Tax=Sporothrix epigloea TaxID=1892477 RepID=A0ABP0D3H5_9PEZI